MPGVQPPPCCHVEWLCPLSIIDSDFQGLDMNLEIFSERMLDSLPEHRWPIMALLRSIRSDCDSQRKRHAGDPIRFRTHTRDSRSDPMLCATRTQFDRSDPICARDAGAHDPIRSDARKHAHAMQALRSDPIHHSQQRVGGSLIYGEVRTCI